MTENSITLVRSLKGAPISILFAMAMAGEAVGAEWLGRTTGYSDHTIAQGLLLLEEYGFIVRINRYRWGLGENIKQLPLMVIPHEPGVVFITRVPACYCYYCI